METVACIRGRHGNCSDTRCECICHRKDNLITAQQSLRAFDMNPTYANAVAAIEDLERYIQEKE